MCPACLAMAAVVISGTISAGGLAALAARTGRTRGWKKSKATSESAHQNPRRDDHGKHQDDCSASGVAV